MYALSTVFHHLKHNVGVFSDLIEKSGFFSSALASCAEPLRSFPNVRSTRRILKKQFFVFGTRDERLRLSLISGSQNYVEPEFRLTGILFAIFSLEMPLPLLRNSTLKFHGILELSPCWPATSTFSGSQDSASSLS